ncbi:MAG TPA: DUF3540 domain-containing protein [Polyangiaceae bacterium]|jgi:hypothetical protein
MNSAARRKIHELNDLQREVHLGPGEVVAVMPHEVEVELGAGRRVRAQMALSIAYEPNVGDVLLLLGKGDDHYVVGVLRGSGKTSLSFQGAVDVRATGGPLTLSSDAGVVIHAPETEIHAGKLHVFAGSVVEKLGSLYQRVRDGLQVHAGKMHTVVDDASFLTAKNASIVTEETMSVNGNEIHLG